MLSLAISPCPNDTFIFEHFLLHSEFAKKNQIRFSLHDIEVLNQGALKGEWDIIKVSCAILPKIKHQYKMISSGGALGDHVGPLLISHRPDFMMNDTCNIAIPGVHTTAYKLLKFAFPKLKLSQTKEMIFSDIESAVEQQRVDAGVVIHESRFTIQEKNLFQIIDLGDVWSEKTKLPVPLGCIALKNEVYEKFSLIIELAIKESIQKAWETFPTISNFVKSHAQSIEQTVIQKHIELYVNDYSLHIGTKGFQAIQKLNEM